MTHARSVVVVLCCTLLVMMNNGFVLIGVTAFDPILLHELHISVTALKMRDVVVLWTSGLVAPLIGYLADRVGVRLLFATGAATLSLGMLAYAHVSSAAGLYVLSALLGVSQACSGVVVAVIAISRWTLRHRGLAIGFAISGTSVGNALMPQVNSWLIGAVGWREAFQLLSIAPLVTLPMILFLLREYPDWRLAAAEHGPAADTGLPVGRTLASRDFVLLALSAGISVFAVLGVAGNLVLYGRSLGLGGRAAGGLLGGFFAASLAAQVVSGVAADRLGGQRVLVLGLVLLALGAALLASPELLLAALVIMGLGWGATFTSLETFASFLFGGPTFGRILGMVLLVETITGGLGPVFLGQVYDRTGTWAPGFYAVSLLCLLGAVFSASLRRGSVGSSAPA